MVALDALDLEPRGCVQGDRAAVVREHLEHDLANPGVARRIERRLEQTTAPTKAPEASDDRHAQAANALDSGWMDADRANDSPLVLEDEHDVLLGKRAAKPFAELLGGLIALRRQPAPLVGNRLHLFGEGSRVLDPRAANLHPASLRPSP
jgi:hypothetical protein